MPDICEYCHSHTVIKVPEGDTHPRKVCSKCHKVFYENPKIIAGIIPLVEDKILLCKRAIEPRKNFWTVPSGFMEINETLKEAALREAKEEAGIDATIDYLHTIYDLPHIGQVYFLFKATCQSMAHQPGIETIESQWFSYDHIPWDQLAFSSVVFGLKHLNNDNDVPHYGVFNSSN